MGSNPTLSATYPEIRYNPLHYAPTSRNWCLLLKRLGSEWQLPLGLQGNSTTNQLLLFERFHILDAINCPAPRSSLDRIAKEQSAQSGDAEN